MADVSLSGYLRKYMLKRVVHSTFKAAITQYMSDVETTDATWQIDR